MRTFFKFLLVILILLIAGFGAKKLIETKPTAKRKPISIGAPLVEVMIAEPGQEQVKVGAMGTVVPAREVSIQPQVAGHVVEISPELIPGGRFKAGDMLLHIDDRDYKIAAEQRKAEIAKAMVELKTEKGRQAIAQKEWELLSSEITTTKEGQDMALRKPHIQNAQAALASAQSALEKALLDVERTIIKAPFSAFVKEKFVEVGQYVTPGTKLLTMAGTEQFWVQISVPVNRLPWISIPGINTDEGSAVTVIQESNPIEIVRQGRVIRMLGDLDPVGRMARLLISVEDPFGINNSSETDRQFSENTVPDQILSGSDTVPNHTIPNAKYPLLLGAYVSVEIEGPELSDVFVIPRKAYREGDVVWTVTPEKKLSVKKVEVLWRRKEDVLVKGLKSGDMIITSRISAPVEGMDLKIAETEPNRVSPM